MKQYKMSLSIAIALMLVCFSMVGCAGSNSTHTSSGSESIEDTQSEEAQTVSEEPSENENSGPDLSLDDEEDVVATQFFCLKLPASYVGNVTYHYFQNDDDGVYSLAVCEITSENDGSGGVLFTIDVQTTEPDYLDAVECKYLGKLISEDEEIYYAVLMYPSDVQFGPDTEEAYTQLYDQIDEVIDGFSAAEGYSFRESAPSEQ